MISGLSLLAQLRLDLAQLSPSLCMLITKVILSLQSYKILNENL